MYIGHLPSEFDERELKNFLQQFGNVVNIRISRSVQTGNARGYAFVRWEDAETARVVADTLQGYFVGQRRLVCHAVPNPHKSMFYNTDKVIQRRQLKRKVAEKERERALGNAVKIKEITARLVQRERKKRAKLAALGIDYDFPGYEASQMNDEEDEAVDDISKVQESSMPLDDEQEEAPQSEKKKKKRKDSVDSAGSASSSQKRKNSEGSESSAPKKSHRTDSVGSEVSAGNTTGSDSGKKKRQKTIEMEKSSADTTPEKSTKKEVQSDKKKPKAKKNKKRRESAP